jgi:phosphoribosylformylglycinamidine cyclo-ligase
MLSPTRTYLPVLKDIFAVHRKNLSGLIHCTGGAQAKVLKFVKHKHIIKNNLFPVPPLFQIIQNNSHTDWQEMYQVFNMGHRMEIYTNELVANEIIEICGSFDLDAQIIGHVEESKGEKVTIESEHGRFEYT